MFKFTTIALTCSVIVLLFACGGGGGAEATFPVQKALTTAYTNGLQNTLQISGSASNGIFTYPVTGSLSLAIGPATSTTFKGAVALKTTTTVNGTLTINGQSLPLNTTGISYLDLSYSPLAFSTTESYCEADSAVAYPENVAIGQTGTLGSFTCYTSPTKANRIGTETETYIATAGSTTNTLDVRIITTIYDTSMNATGSGSLTYRLTSGGLPSLSQFVMTTTANGLTINITAM